MEYMRNLTDNAFDLAIVDPPYGSANSEFKNGGDLGKDSRDTWNRLKGGRRERYYYPPQKKRTQAASKEELGLCGTDDAKPG